MERVKTLLVLLTVAALILGAAADPPTPVREATHPLSGGQSYDVPFRLYHDYLIVVDGMLGELAGRHLVIDTGSSPTILDTFVARRLGLRGRGSDLDLLNGRTRAKTSVLSSLTLGPITAKSLPVLVADLSFLQRSIGARVDAIVGLDVLQASNFLIDYGSQKMTFGSLQPLPDSAPFETGPPFVTVRMQLQGEPVRLLVDTGASGLLLFSGEHNALSWLPVMRVQNSTSISGPFEREQVAVSDVRLGNTNLGRQTAFLVHTQKEIFSEFDGLIGIPAIGIRQIAFDFECRMVSWRRR